MPECGPWKYREEYLDFAFDASWSVCSHWDREAVYESLKQQASGSGGVDFVGIRSGKLFLVEVKDYRGSEKDSSTREKLADDGALLADAVARKVRGTVAGLVGAARTEREVAWKTCVASLVHGELFVVLWVEHAAVDARSAVRSKRAKVGAVVTLLPSLKKRCRWLGAHAAICSRGGEGLPGVEVTSVPGAARMRGRRA